MEPSQNFEISTDPETKGFDLSAGKTWTYPENYPVRDYQLNIVKASLYCNTLVCLPTGLGKTFIGAVIMYNFWRWYPCGKVVFLAPTKPLVAQQIFACYNVMGIPKTETVELTGATQPTQRKLAWSKHRVIFATPQVFQNDLEKNIAPADLIKCVVIDEAHRALRKHSYCECIKILNEKHKNYRILALSATPGNKLDNVHEVIQNLCIAHIELRDETSSDIIPYINERKVEIILVPLNNELTEFKEKYIFIMDRHVKYLIQNNMLRGQTANISKGRIFYLMKEFQKMSKKPTNHGQIQKTINILMTMYHAYEVMVRDGLRAFIKFYQSHSDKFWMNQEVQLLDLLENIETYLGEFPDAKSLCPESEIPQNLIFGHTKFEKLKELLVRHFKKYQSEEDNTRAIVFVEYRDIVSEVYVLLLQCRPLIRPQMFVGQAGLKQKEQIKALEDFRDNRVNVLISTCIGEEGLDVGEVDLIICFDISQHSPIRLVQRMGRTGRKRDGHIVILVTDGKEHETLKTTIARRDSLNNKILHKSNISSYLYQDNPRMIPDSLSPECLMMHITVQPSSPTVRGKRQKKIVEKKPAKRKNALKKIPAIGEPNTEPQCSGTKSLMDFFQSRKHVDVVDDDFEVPTRKYIPNVKYSKTIKSNDVKILSCDTAAVDFLTLCAVINSQKDISMKKIDDISNLYLPKFAPIENFFEFSVPDKSILSCLATLEEVPRQTTDNNVDFNEYDFDYRNDPCSYDNMNNDFDEPLVVDMIHDFDDNDFVNNSVGESKFEDLLDDSSKSNESDGFSVVEEDKENQNNVGLIKEFADLPQQIDNDVKTAVANTSVSCNLEPGSFEDILNETSDESECASVNAQIVEAVAETSSKYYDTCNDATKDVKTSIKMKRTLKLENFEFDRFTASYRSQCTTKNSVTSDACLDTKPKSLLSVSQAVSEIDRNAANSDTRVTFMESEEDMFDDDFGADLINMGEDFHEPEMKCSIVQSEPEMKCSIVQNEPEMKCSIVQSESEMKCSIVQNEPEMKCSIVQSEPEMKCSIARNEPEMKCSIEQVIPTGLKKLNIRNDREKKSIDSRFELEEFEWDDDFEVCDSKQNDASFNSVKEEKNESKGGTSSFTAWDSDDEWFTVDKSVKKSTPVTSIAKKLSSVRKNLKRDSSLNFNSLAKNRINVQSSSFLEEKDKSSNRNCTRNFNNLAENRVDIRSSSFFEEKDKSSNRSCSRNFDNVAENRVDISSSFEEENDISNRNCSRNSNSLTKNRVDVQSSSFFEEKDRSDQFDVSYFFEDLRENVKSKRVNNAKSKRLEAFSTLRNKQRNKQKKVRNQFIDDEAQVSPNDDDNTTEESSGTDQELEDFVSYTQNVHDTSDMKAHYLQTIRSPVKRRDGFIFKEPQAVDPDIEIYSQPVSQAYDTYMNDSFCVGDDEEPSTKVEELCELEKAEQELERRKRKRAGRIDNAKKRRKTNRRKNIIEHSSSSEDETARLREQIQEESFLLAQKNRF
ncbi:FA complementation group M isoform X1 [Megalopta genalis]|uniref:FA complementation group M isoform X1 n=1 Tax=Megalopta genalis TaxID=115081 RepID=UPI003FD2D6E8